MTIRLSVSLLLLNGQVTVFVAVAPGRAVRSGSGMVVSAAATHGVEAVICACLSRSYAILLAFARRCDVPALVCATEYDWLPALRIKTAMTIVTSNSTMVKPDSRGACITGVYSELYGVTYRPRYGNTD